MKDITGTELEEGQYIFYFHSGSGGMIFEDAEIITIREHSIRVKFLGTHRSENWGKKQGDESNIFNTTGKVFVFNKNIELERINKNIELERIAFKNQINELIIENNKLKEENNKIYSRFEILDL